MKDQFRSVENLPVRFGPFIDKLTGDEILTGTCAVTFKRPVGTTGSLSATWDSDIQIWKLDMNTNYYEKGEWLFKAISDNPNARVQRKVLQWGDYVDNLDESISTRCAQTTASLIKASTDLIPDVKAKTSLLPADPASQAVVDAAVSVVRGLIHDNSYIDQTAYDGDGHMTSARVRHYDSAVNAAAHGATGLVHTYRLTATFASGTMTSYLMVQE